MQKNLEEDLVQVESARMQSLLKYVSSYGARVVKYVNNKELVKVLDKAKTTSSDDIELIAKSLVVEDVNKIMIYDLLLYGQIIAALRKAEST